MAVYAIADLHLGHSVDKPMGVFGTGWQNHEQKIAENWRNTVSEGDLVLIAGDISWAMTLDEAEQDLRYIAELPGTKVMIRGNHDYWWNGIGKVRNALAAETYALQNDSYTFGDLTVCGSRGWLLPSHPKFTETDRTIVAREVSRLKLSLEAAKQTGNPLVAMIHYPPLGPEATHTPFTTLLSEYGVKLCVYGHLHGASHRYAFEGVIDGVHYRLTSADYLNFTPLKVWP